MSSTATSLDYAAAAFEAANRAAARGGIEVRRLDDLEAIRRAVKLFRAIWGPEDQDLISVPTLRALSHSDNYVFGAYLDSRMVGAVTGFVGWHGRELQLHSHILGVMPDVQDRKVGFALKEHQRAWSLAKGINTVTWTFDPLVSRNAYFNLTKLGAAVTAYYPSFYGAMNDGINGRDESDRVLVEWALVSPRAVEASSGDGSTPDLEALRGSGADVVLSVGPDESPLHSTGSGERILVGIPRDIVDLRQRDPGLAGRWRSKVRDVLAGALDDGYVIAAMARPGYYVLERIK